MRISKHRWLVMQLVVLAVVTVGFLGVRPHLARAVTVNPSLIGSPMAGSGIAGDPYVITTCEQLQDVDSIINDDQYFVYILGNDIDCSGSGGFNSGAGFKPIGSNGSFTGSLDGRNHSIDNLTITATDTNGRTALFAHTHTASINNVKILNITVTGTSAADGNGGTAAVIGYAGDNTTIDRVTVSGDISSTDCSNSPNVGGIIGVTAPGNTPNFITTTSSSGNLHVSGTNCSDYTAAVGGLVGNVVGTGTASLEMYNVYSTMDITLEGNQQTACVSEHCRAVGGLIGVLHSSASSLLINGYSTGGTEIVDNGAVQEYRVGGIIGIQYTSTQLQGVFSSRSFAAPAGCELGACDDSQHVYGALVGDEGGNWSANTIVNVAYDRGLAPNDSCYNNLSDTDCQAYNIGGLDPNYLKGNTTNGPLGSFEFPSVWNVVVNDYPVLNLNQSFYPNKITNVTTSVVSTTTINVSWVPVNAPSELYDYQIICKLSDETVWGFCLGDIANTQTSASITGLTASTSYDFRVVPRAITNAYPGEASVTATGVTATPGFTLVSTCQQLQDINNDLEGFYELAGNIDCSDTATWNSGMGFDPIGNFNYSDLGATGFFTGILKGNNYTISNIYSDLTSNGPASCGLFAATSGYAVIQDLKLDSPVCLADGVAGNLIGVGSGSNTITNTHVTNGVVGGDLSLAGGGMIWIAQSNESEYPGMFTVQKSSFTGSINAHNPMYIGGFAGSIIGDIDVQNNYSNAQVTTDAATAAGGFAGTLAMADGATLKNNYGAGSINIVSSDPNLNPAELYGIIPDTASLMGGFTAATVGIETADYTMSKNFTYTSLSSQSPENAQGGFLALMIPTAPAVFDNYYDADLAGSSDCALAFSPGQPSCTGISGQPDYFKNNSTNPPLNSWDFDSIWMTTSELPVFGTKVTTGITTISEERLNQPKTTPKPPTGEAPDVSVADNPLNAAIGNQNTSSGITANSEPTDEQGVLGAIKHFVRNLPEAVVVAFPYALFGLLLLAALALLVELYRELRRLHIVQALLHKQQLLAEERDAFWHLAANYLRAPVTLIVGGAEALHEANVTSLSTDLQTIAASLQQKVAQIMAKIEGSTSLQSISQVQTGRVTHIARRALFIVPVVSVAVLATFANYAATSYRNMSPGVLGYVAQIAGFILVSIIFYWVLSLLTSGKSKRKAAEAQLEQQTAELNHARHELIEDTAKLLNPDLTVLEGTLAHMSVDEAALEPSKTLREGTQRLREIVRSFSLLIKVQEDPLLPQTTQSIDLNSILTKVRSKLTPQITAKGVRVVAPATSLPITAENDLANQVIESIVANAVDYSPNNGTVKVEARKLQDAIQLRISDEGRGINAKQLDHLFQPFVRTDGTSAMDMSHGGFGINLYLDKLIMEKLGGSISATSTPGKGTAITMTWPA